MGEIEIQLLGRFSARRGGEEIPTASFGGRLVRVLIRLLVTRRGAFVARDVLAEALWPGRMPADPGANLRVLVQRARAALGDPSIIVTGPGGYSFSAGPACVVDTELFLAGVQAGRDHLAAGHAGAALRELVSALERWGGEPLAEDAYEEWAQETRAELGRAYLRGLEEAAEAALALRDPGQAVVLSERAVAREPLRESAALLLARALAASGDQVAALRAIDGLRRRLAEDVGLDPSAEAVALETRLQRGEPMAEVSRRPVVARVGSVFEGLAFVGRDDELELVLTAVRGPDRGVAVVAGSAGAGKSRLLSEVADRSDVPVLSVRAFLPERNEPWSLARAVLREALALDLEAAGAIADRAARALADIVPELEELRPVANVTVDPESRRALAVEAAARVMTAATAKGALLIVDDIQWADATSLAVLGLVTRRIHQVGVALAYRPEEVALENPARIFLDELGTVRERFVEVPLGPMTSETVSLLVADDDVAAALAGETDGTPMAIAETVRSLAAEGLIEPDARGRWELRHPEAARRAREIARSGQRRVIALRADRQPPDRRQLLSVLALLGREAPARILARATERAEGKVLDDLDALARAGLARIGDAGWATAHDLIGDVVAEGLDRAEAGRLHQVLARAVEGEGGDPAEVGRHLAGAGDPAAAASAFSEAARQRLLQFAGDEARQLADAGLALDPQLGIRTALLRTRAEARALRGDLPGARDDLREALPAIPRGSERSRALARIAEITATVDDYVQAGELIEVALAEAAGDEAARAEALTTAAFFDVNRNELRRAETRAAEALALFERLGEPAGVASILDLRALMEFFRGRLTVAGDLFDRAARLYLAAGQLLKVGSTRGMRGWMLALQDHPEKGLPDAEEALELERSLGQTEGEAGCLWLRSEILAALGRVDEARQDCLAGLALNRTVGNREAVSCCLRGWAALCRAAGDLDGAEAALREALEVGAGMPLQVHQASAHLASLLVEQGDLEAAERYAAAATKGGGYFEFEGRLVLAEIALARGDPEGERVAGEALHLTEAGGYRSSPTRRRLAARIPRHHWTESGGPLRRRERKTFMFTDIVQSTNLVETLGDEGWDHLLRWHDQTLRSLFTDHRGQEINRIGDGFFVVFDRPGDGVDCALEIQRMLERHRAEHGFAPRVRIGLHESEATREGDDYQGRGVHQAARIGALAAGGEVLVSRAALSDADGFRLSDPRTVTLKGFSQPVEVVSVDWR